VPRCGEYAGHNTNGYCPAHYNENARSRKITHNSLGPDNRRFRWMRSAFLMRHPVCAMCQHEVATELDHVMRHRGDSGLFWDQNNWQGLCARCHGIKTAREVLHPTKQRGSLTVLMGAPGAGKSTWAAGRPHVITTDELRGIQHSPARVNAVFERAWARVDALLAAGQDVTLDTTAAHRRIRAVALRVARARGARLSLVVLDTDLDTCIARQQGRRQPVAPRDVLRVHQEIQAQLPTVRSEGWDDVQIIRTGGEVA